MDFFLLLDDVIIAPYYTKELHYTEIKRYTTFGNLVNS